MDARKLLAGAALGLALVIASASQAVAVLPTTPDPTWGTNGKVDVVLRVGSTVYLGGTFTELDDTATTATAPASNLAGIDTTTGAPTGFAPTLDGEVFALAASPDGSRLYVGGNFNTVNGKTQKKIAVFNTATGALIAWSPPPDGRTTSSGRSRSRRARSTSGARSPRSARARSRASPS